ncbi:hypothetical protein Q2K19_27050 [Micromonospora soli]|uniref:hypothetical protein n=1 Tax=Micromonospora sp. NBRC 110009 TaxID=3061627 RepID=UPI002673AC40|nr:hypothetical protein [Micromonospora sp. NBRC 110009]WKT97801.1 hypothetical protein Q2K19_27050 [Micromonospora sp. NBRC 110009]
MTRPEEPTEALTTRPLPVDPGATVDLDRTLPVGGAEPTVPLAATDATVHLAATDATVHLGAPERTAHLGGPTAAEPAVHFAATADPRPTTAGPTLAATAPATAGTGGATGAYPRTTGEARAATGAAQPAPGGEVRFGPGVPVTPPAAPAWPTVAGARRPRPLWRRVVSALSTLLTAALLVVVGLYLWQRLSPLEVEGVSVAVPQPAGERCDVTVDVVATVRTNGRGGVIRYQWLRSDAPPGALLTERVGRGQRTATLTLKWTFSGVGATTGTATVNLVEPSPVQAGTQVAYRCRRG